MLNLAILLEDSAREVPERTAVICEGTRLSYAQIQAATNQVARGLIQMGIHKGDKVALTCQNTPSFVIAYFGILKAGAVVVPLNVLLKPREIAYHLKDSQAKALIAFEGSPELPMAQIARAGCDEAGCSNLVIMTTNPEAPAPVAGAQTLTQLTRGQSARFEAKRRRPDDTAVILYTSGTTGHPKGAELTHANMLLNAVATHDMLIPAHRGGFEQDVALVTLPLFHSTAQTCQMNSGLYGGF